MISYRQDGNALQSHDTERQERKGYVKMNKWDELLSVTKLRELLKKDEEKEQAKNVILWVLAIVGAVVAIAGIAYAVYHLLSPDYLEDFEDDLDDDLEEDDFEEEDEFVEE